MDRICIDIALHKATLQNQRLAIRAQGPHKWWTSNQSRRVQQVNGWRNVSASLWKYKKTEDTYYFSFHKPNITENINDEIWYKTKILYMNILVVTIFFEYYKMNEWNRWMNTTINIDCRIVGVWQTLRKTSKRCDLKRITDSISVIKDLQSLPISIKMLQLA